MDARLPKTIRAWKRLPELPSGQHRVVNLGAMEASLAKCRAENVEGIPPPLDEDEEGLGIHLPNVTVEIGKTTRVFRLHPDFGPIVKKMFEEAGRLHKTGRNLLPADYTFGMAADGAFVVPTRD